MLIRALLMVGVGGLVRVSFGRVAGNIKVGWWQDGNGCESGFAGYSEVMYIEEVGLKSIMGSSNNVKENSIVFSICLCT